MQSMPTDTAKPNPTKDKARRDMDVTNAPASPSAGGERLRPHRDDRVSQALMLLGTVMLNAPASPEILGIACELAASDIVGEWPMGAPSNLEAAQTSIRQGVADGQAPLLEAYRILFEGPQHLQAPPWGSVYLDPDSVIFGISTLDLRRWLKENGIQRDTSADRGRLPDDHIGNMLVLLGWLIAEKPQLVDGFLTEHLVPWAFRYLHLAQEASPSPFFRGCFLLAEETLAGLLQERGLTPPTRKLYF